jgi:S-formylglutathione hydrolase FrmB
MLLFLADVTRSEAATVGRGSPEFRAVGGVSMGAYGAMNIGLSHPDLFETIASLGGPLDMAYLLKFVEVDLLGNYDAPDPYPSRKTLIRMLQDLAISFGNPVYFNPDSTFFPPRITGATAKVPTTLLDFKDGKYNRDGSLPVITYEDPKPGDWVKVLLALDVNKNEKRDKGEPVLNQFHERFTDQNGNGFYDPGETFFDYGLDGVEVTGDHGEGDGLFTYNPRRDNFMGQDPLTQASNLGLASLQNLNLYVDAGTTDEFQFNTHAENFVQTLLNRNLDVRIEDGFPETFPGVSHFDEKRVYVRYEGGHVGVKKEDIGLGFKQARKGVEGAITVANRFTTLFAFVSDHFPEGEYGTDPIEMFLYPSKMKVRTFYSRSLKRYTRFGIYLPPGYSRNDGTYYPVLYLLGGYKMSLEGMTNAYMRAALDALIVAGEMQKMIIVVPEGMNDKNGRGHFFVNQIDLKRGDRFMDSFFDLVNFVDARFRTK